MRLGSSHAEAGERGEDVLDVDPGETGVERRAMGIAPPAGPEGDVPCPPTGRWSPLCRVDRTEEDDRRRAERRREVGDARIPADHPRSGADDAGKAREIGTACEDRSVWQAGSGGERASQRDVVRPAGDDDAPAGVALGARDRGETVNWPSAGGGRG